MQAVFLDVDSIGGDIDLSPLEQSGLTWQYFDTLDRPSVQARINNAEVVISNKLPLDRATLQACPSLKLICISATGTDNVDLEAAREQGIYVCNARAYATASVVQHVFTLILALNRRLPQYQYAARTGEWQKSPFFCMLDFPIEELNGQTLGIIGYGELGQGVEKLAHAFGMRTLIAESLTQKKQSGRMPLKQLLSEADVISLHCPLTQESRNLISTAEFECMKPNALLINTARGGIVDEHALVRALEENRIAGAALDVLEHEPPNDKQPLLTCSHPNLIITPHIAWAGRQARQTLIQQVADSIAAFLEGEAVPRRVC